MYNSGSAERSATAAGPNTQGIGRIIGNAGWMPTVWIITLFTRATRTFTVTLGNARAGCGCWLCHLAVTITFLASGNARSGLARDVPGELVEDGLLVIHVDCACG